MNEVEDVLRPHVRRAAAMLLTKATRPTSPLLSKFGGTPYFEQNESWPECGNCKDPLSFICQVDLRETGLAAPDGVRFFTFFYCWNCLPFASSEWDRRAWLVRLYEDPLEAKAVSILPPDAVEHAAHCEISFAERLSLPVWEGGHDLPNVFELCEQRNGDAPWEAYQEVVERIAGVQEIESRIGGYPHWIQGNDTADTIFLAQIDSEDEAKIMWGDVGSVYLFLSKESKPEASLVFQCC